MIFFLISAALVLSANAFLSPRFARNVMSTGSIVRQELSLSAIKPDLFSGNLFQIIYNAEDRCLPIKKPSHIHDNEINHFNSLLFNFIDDLFDDEDDTPKKKVAKDSAPPKQKYLDQKWKLADEDAKEFTGFAKKEGTNERLMERLDAMEEVAPADRVPSVALIYNFRREYKEQNLEATLSEHRAHCLKFNKRLLHSEVINTKKTKGVVLLWVGLSPGDDLVRQEMMLFMEEDPLIVKDIVDNWNIQVLTVK